MLRRMLFGAVAWMGLGLALPAAGATITLTVTGGGIDSDLTRTCSAVSSGSSEPVPSLARLARSLASPQSMTWTSPNAPTITLAGFRSRWMTPRSWA